MQVTKMGIENEHSRCYSVNSWQCLTAIGFFATLSSNPSRKMNYPHARPKHSIKALMTRFHMTETSAASGLCGERHAPQISIEGALPAAPSAIAIAVECRSRLVRSRRRYHKMVYVAFAFDHRPVQ